jgi:hypothetical protein
MTEISENSIKVHEASRLSEVQSAFNELFPFLRIGFYTKASDIKNGFKLKVVENLNNDLNRFTKKSNAPAELIITPDLSVSDLDKMFFGNFGLNIQIHRNSGRLWLQINATDSWSLEEQNKQGRDLCA